MLTIVSAFGSTAGGAEQWLVSLVRAWRHRVRVRVILLQEGPLALALAEVGAQVETVPVRGLGTAEMLRGMRGVHGDLRRHPPHVVMGNGVKAQAALALPARAQGLPSLWVKHDYSFDNVVSRPLGRLSTKVLATAAEVGEAVHRSDLIVVEPERPPPPLPPEAALNQLAGFGYIPDGRPALAIVGRLVPYKGVDVAVSALAYGLSQPWRLVVIGGDDDSAPGETKRLQRLAADLGVDERVNFCGPVPGAGRLLKGLEALAVLTRPGQAGAPQREGYGITATEAMLAALPVITAGEGSVARRLRMKAGDAGIVVRAGDPLATAGALNRLASRDLRLRMGQLGCEGTQGLASATEVADAVLGVLEDLAGAS